MFFWWRNKEAKQLVVTEIFWGFEYGLFPFGSFDPVLKGILPVLEPDSKPESDGESLLDFEPDSDFPALGLSFSSPESSPESSSAFTLKNSWNNKSTKIKSFYCSLTFNENKIIFLALY